MMRLPFVGVVCALLLTACGPDVGFVSLAELVDRQHEYDGERVATRGVLRTYDDPRHYWIEDEALNRVGLFPEDELPGLVGRELSVVGHFAYGPKTGRSITIERMQIVQ